tara:strand:+ start:458 stop:1090 length:633 start_codon:yes stop_codon:yes gene_type:complete
VADERLELLRQRFLETASVEDEAQWLRERLRVGELERKNAQTAAALGHAGCRLALDSQSKRTKRLEGSFHVLAQLNMEALLRATALLLRALSAEARQDPVWGDPLVRQALGELEAWLVHPIPWNKAVLLRTIRNLPLPTNWRQQHEPAEVLGRVASWLESGVHERSRFLLLPLNQAPRGLRATLRKELIPWILGYGDPLAGEVRSDGTLP